MLLVEDNIGSKLHMHEAPMATGAGALYSQRRAKQWRDLLAHTQGAGADAQSKMECDLGTWMPQNASRDQWLAQ